jgi:putative ABC transport system permease protein
MRTLWQDLRFGMRMLLKNHGFTSIAVVTLALGIGANTAIFSVVDAVLLRPLPYPEADRLVYLWSTLKSQGILNSGSSMPDYREWRDQNHTLEGLAGFFYADFNLSETGTDPERVVGASITYNLFHVLKVSPMLGRLFTPEENQFGRHRVVLLSNGLWRRSFGEDRTVVGREIKIGSESFTIAGVMPQWMPFFDNTRQVELWTPIAFAPGDANDTRGNHFVDLVGRLKPGFTIEQAQADASAIARRMAEQHFENKGIGASIAPVQEQLTGSSRNALYVLLGAVSFVLLVACVNVANLMLARAAAREREIAIRASLGASRMRIVRQMMVECLPLGLMGGILGVLLALWVIDLLRGVMPASLPRYNEIGVNSRVLLFTLALALFTVFLFGLLPALQTVKADVRAALSQGGRGGIRQGLLRRLLVVAEVALALVLLAGAGLMVRSFVKLRQLDLGFTGRNVLTMRVPLPDAKYPFPSDNNDLKTPAGLSFFEQLLARIKALPGVKAVAAGTLLPIGAGSSPGKYFTIAGRPAPSIDRVPIVNFALISDDYFRTLGISLRRGRSFTDQDKENSQPVAIINEQLARRFFPNEDPLGKTIWMGVPEELLPPDARSMLRGLIQQHRPAGAPAPENLFVHRVVIGVAADVKGGSLNQPSYPIVYAPLQQHACEDWNNSMMLAVQADGAPESLAGAIREQVRALDKDQPVTGVRTLDQLVNRSLAEARFNFFLLSLFSIVGLTLAAIGIYGMISYAVAQRTHEIGIRLALGAQPGNVLLLVVRQGMELAVAGVALGVASAWALTRWMATMLFEVRPTDPLTFASIALLMLGVALMACYIPARRAAKVDPMVALKYE